MRRFLLAFLVAAVGLPASAGAANIPVLTADIPAGGGTTTPLKRATDPARIVDGNPSDWTGALPGFGGAQFYSRGEFVYEDHIFDAYGADNGQDAQRLAVEQPLQDAVPETYRVDPALEYVPEEFGVPMGPFTYSTHYGDLEHQDQADLSQVRIGTDASSNLWLLARTTTMSDTKPATALLVLLDTQPGSTTRDVGFGTGLKSAKADVALYLQGDKGLARNLASGAVVPLPAGSVATDASGYTNAIEARLPAGMLGAAAAGGADGLAGIAVAAGKPNAAGNGFDNIANVAFRTKEPSRDWWEQQQALALQAGSIDDFFATPDFAAMRAGRNERYHPTAGYYDRIFESSPAISSEGARNGILQHYGLYIPTGYSPDRANPVQWWFHFRGGRAHIAAAVVPGVIKQMGEDANSLVVTPDGRGSSTWYVGKGQVDFREVWADVHRLVRIDRNREYIAGHSMGGWASWLLPILYPDRFAAAFPASGPPTQGLWAGCEQDACFQSANDGRPRDEWTTPLLENLRWVPYVNYQGAADELVPVSGVTAQMEKMRSLGLRYRYYVFPHEEHYGPPIFDQWAEGVKYEHQFTRNPNPPSVTLIRSMPMERAVEEVNSGAVALSFDFDTAFWVSRLEPADEQKGTARIDVRSLAIPEPAHDAMPEVVPPISPEQTDPSVEEGQSWVVHPGTEPPARNGFTATLSGARSVRLDLRRMRLSTRRPIVADVTADRAMTIELVSGKRVITIQISQGHHTLTV